MILRETKMTDINNDEEAILFVDGLLRNYNFEADMQVKDYIWASPLENRSDDKDQGLIMHLPNGDEIHLTIKYKSVYSLL
jgi:hypothetical protein